MNARIVDGLEIPVFGQLAEQIEGGRGDYPSDVIDAVRQRLKTDGPVVGRVSVIGFVHDGEVGPQIAVVPIHAAPMDLLSQGV